MIKAVFFDLGNTLVNFNVNGSLLDKVCHCINWSKEKVRPIFHDYLLTKNDNAEKILHGFVGAIGKNKAELISIFKSHSIKPVLFSDTIKILEDLKNQGVFLGVVSNTSVLNYITLAALNLNELIDVEILSFKVGVAKPDKKIFEFAEMRAQTNSENILLVGDSVRSDLFGAKRAGWQAILLNRTHKKLPEFCNQETVVSSLKPIAKMILTFNKIGKFV